MLNGDPSLESIAAIIRSGKCKNIVLLCGAGISVSAGIPDFRTPGTGLYHNLQNYGLPDDQPTAIFDINFYKSNPRPFCRLAQEMYPQKQADGNLKYAPTITHHFIALLHGKGLLQRCYTQNIDVLERMAGVPVEALVECHGSFSGGRCTLCGSACDADWLKDEFFKDEIPLCARPKAKVDALVALKDPLGSRLDDGRDDGRDPPVGKTTDAADGSTSTEIDAVAAVLGETCQGYCKPDITFFGEPLPARFHELKEQDTESAQLLIVMGTSLQVAPVCGLPGMVDPLCPRLLINREACSLASDPTARLAARVDPDAASPEVRKEEEEEEEEEKPTQDNDTGFRFHLKDNYRDVFVQDDCDTAVLKLCELLGWQQELRAMALAAASASGTQTQETRKTEDNDLAEIVAKVRLST